jgi:transposase
MLGASDDCPHSQGCTTDQKKLATLKASQGWTNTELARHFGVSVSTIKVYLYDYDRTGSKVMTPKSN